MVDKLTWTSFAAPSFLIEVLQVGNECRGFRESPTVCNAGFSKSELNCARLLYICFVLRNLCLQFHRMFYNVRCSCRLGKVLVAKFSDKKSSGKKTLYLNDTSSVARFDFCSARGVGDEIKCPSDAEFFVNCSGWG